MGKCCDKIRKMTVATWMDLTVIFLSVACVVLVVLTICFGCKDYNQNKKFRLETMEFLSSLENVANTDTIDLSFTKAELLSTTENAIVDQTGIMDSNNYLSILLTLITLCVTLAVVIPYIVGRTFAENEVKRTVDKLFEVEHNAVELKYKGAIESLTWAEAHLSRMTAYFLQDESEKDKQKHPYWVIGWASKSLIRYFKCNDGRHDMEKFCQNDVEFILNAAKQIEQQNQSVPTDDLKPLVLRSFVDLYDAMEFYNLSNHKIEAIKQNSDQLMGILHDLYQWLKDNAYFNQENLLAEDVAAKAKYREYLSPSLSSKEPTYEAFLDHFSKGVRKIKKYKK